MSHRVVSTVGLLVSATVLVTLAPSPASATFPGSPGRLAFGRAGDIWTMNADGSGVRRLTSTGDNSGADWSPDGRSIAFSSTRSGNADVYVMAADGTGLRRVTTATSNETDPAWSPDGTQLAFASDRGVLCAGCSRTPSNIFRIRSRVPYGQPVQLTRASWTVVGGLTKGTSARSPEWSPDGRRLLFSLDAYQPGFSSGTALHLVSATDGSGERTVDTSATDGSYSPLGAKLLYTSTDSDSGFVALVKADPDNTHQVVLTVPFDTFCRRGVWAPDGRSIAYECGGLYVMKADGTGKRLVQRGATPYSWQRLA